MDETSTNESSESKALSKKPNLSFSLGSLTGPSQVYIVEHFIALVALVLIVLSGINLFNTLIDYLFEKGEPQVVSIYSSLIQTEQMVVALSIALVALPGFALFYTRTRKAERAYPELRSSRARRRLEYIFLALGSVVKIIYVIAFVYTTLLVLVNAGAGASGESWFQTALKQWFAIALIGVVLVLVARMVPRLDEGGSDG